ncbi:MAG TPA: thiamine phosphate synthase [Polyangia bacterium]
MIPPRLYLIAARDVTAPKPLVRVVADTLRAFGALRLPPTTLALQLREKSLGTRDLMALARDLRDLTGVAGVPFLINDRMDVALAVGADGVHLAGTSLALADAAKVAATRTPGLALALSTHHPEELAEAARLRAAVAPTLAFAVFGPVHETPSKRAFGPPQGLARLGAAVAAAGDLPVLALGGFDGDRTKREAALATGAAGISCMRAVLGSETPEKILAALLGV